MLNGLTILIYVVTALLIIGVEVFRRKQAVVDVLSMINVLYLLMYCFVPLNVNFLKENTFRQAYAYATFGAGDEFHATVIFVSYLLIVIAYMAVPKIEGKISLSFGIHALRTVSIVLLVLGIAAFAVRALEVGGFYNALVYSAVIRTGEVEIESKFAFIWIFLGFPLAGVMLLWSAVYQGRFSPDGGPGTTIRGRSFLYLYAAAAVLCYIAASGRRDLLIVPLLMLLAYANVRERFPGFRLALVAVFGVLLLSYAPPIAFGLAYGNLDSTLGGDWLNPLSAAYEIAVQILGDAYMHWVGMSTVPVGKMGLFSDLLNLPFKLLPSRLLGFERSRDILGDASSLFNGVDLRTYAAPGEDEPPGFFGYWYANLGMVGVVAGALLFGLGARLIDRLLSPRDHRKIDAWLLYWWIAFAWCSFLRDGYLEFIVKERLAWWIALFLLLTHRWACRLGRTVPA